MRKFPRNLPHPISEKDKAFMDYLLAGVRAKYEAAIKPKEDDRKNRP